MNVAAAALAAYDVSLQRHCRWRIASCSACAAAVRCCLGWPTHPPTAPWMLLSALLFLSSSGREEERCWRGEDLQWRSKEHEFMSDEAAFRLEPACAKGSCRAAGDVQTLCPDSQALCACNAATLCNLTIPTQAGRA